MEEAENKIHKEIVFRPWGKYETIYYGSGFKVKIITVNPGQRLSLQRHRWRDEHWFIVEGRGRIYIERDCEDYEIRWATKKSSHNIPWGVWHRIENKEQTPLVFVEVQTGNCFEEDIERKEDDYNRK